MYTKGTVLELQFSLRRLNDGAGEPYWIDLSREEALRLRDALQQRLDANLPDTAPPAVVSLDSPDDESAAVTATTAPVVTKLADGAFRQWVCIICGWVYDEEAGLPEEGIPPGTRWEDVPADWRCPLCDVGKEDFAMVPL